jgi:lipid-binding SYLF domain-containing protein
MRAFHFRLMWVMLFACASAAASAHDDQPLQRAVQAVKVLDQIMHAPDRELPQDMLQNAYAVAVIPHVINAGLVVGGRHGEGLISVKKGGVWSNPSFITLSGGSIGLQAGVSSTDVLLIFRSEQGVDSIVNGKFILGTDAAVAAGPVGRNAQASTDAQLKAEIYAYSRARGLFVGVAIQGSALRIDHDANHAVYGAEATPQKIFAEAGKTVPGAVADFRDRLEEYTAH